MKNIILACMLVLTPVSAIADCHIWILWKTWYSPVGPGYKSMYRVWETYRVYFTYNKCQEVANEGNKGLAETENPEMFRCFPMGFNPK